MTAKDRARELAAAESVNSVSVRCLSENQTLIGSSLRMITFVELNQNRIVEPNVPVILTIEFSLNTNYSGSDNQEYDIYRLINVGTSQAQWVRIDNTEVTVRRVGDTLIISQTILPYDPNDPLTGFSTFIVIATARAIPTSLSGSLVFPNPWKPHDGNSATGQPFAAGTAGTGILFDQIVPLSAIQIFNLLGEHVALLKGGDASVVAGNGSRIQWNVLNDQKRLLASGVYIALITSPTGEQKILKFAVIR